MVSVSGGDLADPWQLLTRTVFRLPRRGDHRHFEHVKTITPYRGRQFTVDETVLGFRL